MMMSHPYYNSSLLLLLSRDIGNVHIPYRVMMNLLTPQPTLRPVFQARTWIPTPMERRGSVSLASTCAVSVRNYKYKTRRWETPREERPREASFSRVFLSM